MFNWFNKKPPPPKAPAAPGTYSQMDSTRPMGRRRVSKPSSRPRTVSAEQKEAQKIDRANNRELLFGVVRESMVRAGVLSSSYKFKVLSLDQRGQQFLVMMDLSREFAGDPERMSEIEALIAQRAKTRYDIAVKSVYWRLNEHVAVGQPGLTRPSVQSAVARVEAELPVAPPVPVTAFKRPEYDPIDDDEVNAFRNALVAGVPPAKAAPRGRATGFPDTEVLRDDGVPTGLSATQYGELN